MNLSSKYLWRSLAASALISVYGCGGGKGGGDTRLDFPGGIAPGQPVPGVPFCEDPAKLFTLNVDNIQPQDGETNVANGSVITLFFNREPEHEQINALENPEFVRLTQNSTGETVLLQSFVDRRLVMLEPMSPHFLPGEEYTFTIEADGISGVEDAECAQPGNDPKFLTLIADGKPVDSVDITFETSADDFLAVTMTEPANGASDVSVTVEPVVFFNRPVDPFSIRCDGDDANILLEQLTEEARIPVAVSCRRNNGGAMVTLTPENVLMSAQDYALTVFQGGVDAADNAGTVVETVVSEFTTLVAALDTDNCSSAVGSLCLIGGESSDGGLVDNLLDPNGPLGPIASNIGGSEELLAALEVLLQSDDGSLESLLTGLLIDGNLQEALELLLLGDEDGNGGLADIIEQLLLGNEEGAGLVGLLGEDGVQGLLEALLLDPADPDCQAPLGNVCLVTGDGSQPGVLDLLIGEGGALAPLGLTETELLNALGDTLESDGSLENLVTNLLMEGQLQQGLETLLLGDPNDPDGSGVLLAVLQGLLDDGGLIDSLLREDGFLDALLGIGGLLGGGEGDGDNPLQDNPITDIFEQLGILDLLEAEANPIDGCSVQVGNLCVLAEDGEDGVGLVDALLLADNSPLGPLADNIGGTEELAEALRTLLENDGTLRGLLTGLVADGQLQEGLELLLLGDDEGNGGLADILEQLLLGNEDGAGLVGLLGEDGVQGLVEALLLGTEEGDCQSALGTVCLVSGDSDQQGVLDLLIGEGGALAPLGLEQEELLAVLGLTLENDDGSLADLVSGLLADGQLQQGLTLLLAGDPDSGSPGVLAVLVGSLFQDGGLIEGLLGESGLLDSLLGIGALLDPSNNPIGGILDSLVTDISLDGLLEDNPLGDLLTGSLLGGLLGL